MKEVLGDDFDKSTHNMEKIANGIIATGEYIKEPSKQEPWDYNILKNPNYKPERWIDKNPITFEFIKGGIVVIASVLASIITSKITTENVMRDKYLLPSQEQYTPIEQGPSSKDADRAVPDDSIRVIPIE